MEYMNSMKISFSIWSSVREHEEKEIIRAVRKHDPDYAALMVCDYNPLRIDTSMLETLDLGLHLVEPEIPDDKARSFILEIMQKKAVYRIYPLPSMADEDNIPIFYNQGCDGSRITKAMFDFMVGASGESKWDYRYYHHDTPQAAAQALKNLMKNAL